MAILFGLFLNNNRKNIALGYIFVKDLFIIF